MGLIHMEKREILLLISLILVLGVMQLSGAVQNFEQFNATIANITRLGALSATPRYLAEYRNGFYLNITGGSDAGVPGHQYQMNVSFNNSAGNLFNVTTI